MSSLYVQGRNKNHHHSDDDGDEMANGGNRTHKIHVCMLLSDTTQPPVLCSMNVYSASKREMKVASHHHLELWSNPKQNCPKTPKLFLSSMGETELFKHDFLEFSVGPFEARGCKERILVQTHKCSLLIMGLHIFEVKFS